MSEEVNQLGDNQKTPNCGYNPGDTLTGNVTTFTAGETITITIDETIYHPGHYRVALSTGTEDALPDPPPITPVGNDDCGMTEIMDPLVFPVIADGELPHDQPFAGEQSFQVTLPDDVECENCYLQIVQYMREHAAPCFYYHCAVVNIEADPAAGTDTTSGSTGDADPSTSSGGTSTSTTSTSGSATTDSGATTSTTGGGTTQETTTAAATDSNTDSAGSADDEDGGCSVSARPAGSLATVLLLIGLVGLRRRYG